MLSNLISKLLKTSPQLKKFIWKKVYQFLASKYTTKDWTFMNYGFQDHSYPHLEPEDEKNRYFIQLYHHVVTQKNIEGLDALEIGSGRGGGADYVKRYFSPKSMTGLDFSKNAIQFSQSTFSTADLKFIQGDAEQLPFEDNSLDVIINIESSHCYANMDQFIQEVTRTLKPGGYFLFADFRDLEFCDDLEKSLTLSGLIIEKKENISKEVLTALNEFNEEKMKRFSSMFGSRLKKPLEEFAGMEGSTMHTDLSNGNTIYYNYTLKK